MSEGGNKTAKSALPAAIIVGGFVWIVFDSLVLGGVAGVLTLLLMKRDAKEDHDAER